MCFKLAIADRGVTSYTLFELLAGVGLLASTFVFFEMTVGFGTYLARIDAVSCSPDGTLIAVSKRTAIETMFAEDCQRFGRAVSCLDAHTGITKCVVRQDQRGNWGATNKRSFHSYHGISVLWHQAMNQLLVSRDDGGVEFYAVESAPILLHTVSVTLNRSYDRMTMSRSGRYLAHFDVSILVWDIAESRPKIVAGSSVGTKLVFADDESRVLIANDSGLHSWEIPSFEKSATRFCLPTNGLISAVGACADRTVIACTPGEASRFDFSGIRQANWPQIQGASVYCMSTNGHVAAMANSTEVFVIDLRTNEIIVTIPFARVTAMEFLPNAHTLVVGDDDGYVHSIALPSGKVLWRSEPPLKHPISRVWPLVVMLGCGLACAKRLATMLRTPA